MSACLLIWNLELSVSWYCLSSLSSLVNSEYNIHPWCFYTLNIDTITRTKTILSVMYLHSNRCIFSVHPLKLWLILGVPQHHRRGMGDQPSLWFRLPMGHDIHDTISEHVQKFTSNSNCELADIKKDEQLVQSCELRCGSWRQVSISDRGY